MAVHNAKKYSIQLLGGLLTISVQDISMMGGWALNIFNACFDYWVGYFSSSIMICTCMARWTQDNDQMYHGG